MKITKEIRNKIKELRDQGKRVCDIQKELGMQQSQVSYYFNDKSRLKRIKKAVEYAKQNPRKITEKYREYQRKYHNKRYKEDETFREKVKRKSREYQKMIYWKDKK